MFSWFFEDVAKENGKNEKIKKRPNNNEQQKISKKVKKNGKWEKWKCCYFIGFTMKKKHPTKKVEKRMKKQ